MNNLLEQLKQARQAEENALQAMKICKAQLEETPEYKLLQDGILIWEQAKEYTSLIDGALRQEALDLYGLTGDKHPFDKVSIVINRNLIYQEAEAFDWAGKNAPGMLELNKKKFEKHARAVLETMPLDFVKVEEVPSVRIASEL